MNAREKWFTVEAARLLAEAAAIAEAPDPWAEEHLGPCKVGRMHGAIGAIREYVRQARHALDCAQKEVE